MKSCICRLTHIYRASTGIKFNQRRNCRCQSVTREAKDYYALDCACNSVHGAKHAGDLRHLVPERRQVFGSTTNKNPRHWVLFGEWG